jgi:signal peptidase II
LRVILVSALVLIADQITKLLIKGISIPFLNINTEGFQYGKSIEVFGSFFRITFVENPGMAFGIGVGETTKIFLSIFSLAAGIGILIYLYKLRNEKFIIRFALALVLGGAIGNFIDRTFYGILFEYAPLFYGRVVDFLDVDFFDFSLFGHTYNRWPIFNIADTAVTVGVVLLLIFHNTVNNESEVKETEELLNSEISGTPSPVPLSTEIGSGTIEDNSDEINYGGTGNFQKRQVINGEDNNRKSSNN